MCWRGRKVREVLKLYDEVYTTDYKETALGDSLKLKVVPIEDHIETGIESQREVLLLEDELHYHGVS